MSLAYSYDGSFDGLLTSIFEAYSQRENPEEVAAEGNLQEAFGRKAVKIRTDNAKARRVEAGIVKKMGMRCYQKIWAAFLSDDPCKAILIYRYARRGFEIGRAVEHDIAHCDVLPIEKIYINVMRESHFMKEFTRFSQVEGGVYYAKITPKSAVIPLIMPHFADRLSSQPFLVHDDAHKMVGVYNLESWHIVETEFLTVPPPDKDELNYRRMWKNFYETIAIAERINPVCRRTHMPMRFWRNMTEFSHIPPDKSSETSSIEPLATKNQDLPALPQKQ